MKAILEKKLQFLLEYLEEFHQFTEITFTEYERNKLKKRTVERLIQLFVEVGSDIAGIVISETKNCVPETYYECFMKLGEKKILSKTLARKMAASAGLRNRIIHEYGEYKDSIVFANIKPLYNSYLKFYHEMKKYLNS